MRPEAVAIEKLSFDCRTKIMDFDEPELETQSPCDYSNDETMVAQLQQRRSELVEQSHELHEKSQILDDEIDRLRTILDEERSLKQSAVRRLAEKLCNPQCAKIGPLTSKGVVVYERRIQQLKKQLDEDEMELLKRRQTAIDMYNERIAELDLALARQNDELRRLRVKLMSKQREIDDLRLGIEPKTDESTCAQDST